MTPKNARRPNRGRFLCKTKDALTVAPSLFMEILLLGSPFVATSEFQ